MGCCGNRKVKIAAAQRRVVKKVENDKVYRNNSVTKSNRSPAGTITKTCPNCKTTTILRICPVCSYKF